MKWSKKQDRKSVLHVKIDLIFHEKFWSIKIWVNSRYILKFEDISVFHHCFVFNFNRCLIKIEKKCTHFAGMTNFDIHSILICFQFHALDFFFIVSNFVYVFIYRSKFEPKHSPNRKKATRLKWDCECAFYCFEHEIRNMLNDFVVLVAIKKKIEWYCERCMRFKASIWLCFVPVIFFR